MSARGVAVVTLGLVAGFSAGSCAGRSDTLSSLPDTILVGHYMGGGGESWFRPCGASPGDPSWWVTFMGESVDELGRARTRGLFASGENTFVRWRAAVTLGGEVGPQGEGVPAVLVREILEASAPSGGDCDAP